MEMNKNHDYLFKVILIGNTGVGKTCILSSFAGDKVARSHISTIGIDFKMRTIEINGKTVKIQIWDTAGQERYETITTQYYRRAQGIMLVYDITRKETFHDITKWLKYVDEFAQKDVKKLIIGNKCDLEAQRKVTPDEGEELSKKYNVPWMETSAFSNVNVDEAFVDIAKQIYACISEMTEEDRDCSEAVILDDEQPKASSSSSCSC